MAFRVIRRVKLNDIINRNQKGVPVDGSPWIFDWRSFDIPETIEGGIRNAAPGLIALTLSLLGGRKMIFAAERAARERGIRVLWWFKPNIDELSEETKTRLRGWVKEAKGEPT